MCSNRLRPILGTTTSQHRWWNRCPNSGSFSALVWPTWWRWKVRDRPGIRICRIYWVGHVSFVFENWWCDPKMSQVPVEVSEAVDAKLLSFLKIETLHTWCAFQKWIGLLTRRQWAQPKETIVLPTYLPFVTCQVCQRCESLPKMQERLQNSENLVSHDVQSTFYMLRFRKKAADAAQTILLMP